MRNILRAGLSAVVLALPGAGWASDVALIVANRFYDASANAPQVQAIEALAPDLETAGFDVVLLSDVDMDGYLDAIGEAGRKMADADRVLIVLAGQVVHTARDAFLLTTDSGIPDALTVGARGISIGTILDLASLGPELAVVVVADGRAVLDTGAGVTDGFVPTEPPEGVVVFSGGPDRLARFVETELLRPGQTVASAAALADPGEITVTGTPADLPLIAAEGPGVALEDMIWNRVEATNTVAAYERYLSRFPQGRYAEDAREAIRDLTETPIERAARLEFSLEMDGSLRRGIQENLKTLGYYDLAVDGVFGAGTRTGIGRWQADNGFERTGYLTANQITLLQRQAAEREEELRKEREARDRAFWNATGQGADEAGLRAYLNRFPDGLFADLARDRLQAIEAEKRAEEEAADRAAWNLAKAADTVPAYRRYLEAHPGGLFADEARAAIDRLTGDRLTEEERRRAIAGEEALNLVPTGRRLIEIRLQMLGYEVGPVDGTFDPVTRRAIRAYQDDRSLPATGYINQPTLVRLLAEVVR